MMSLGLYSTADVITFDQNWHHIYLTAGGKDLSNDTPIKLISSMEPEICMNLMLKKFSEKLRAEFSATSSGYFMVKIAHLDDAFSEFFELEASPIEGQSLRQKEKKRGIRRSEENLKNRKD